MNDTRMGVPQESELVDPLQIASEGLEEVEEDAVDRSGTPADSGDHTRDPLTLLSLAIDQEAAQAAADAPEEAPRRGRFGLRGRVRTPDRGWQDDEQAAPTANETTETTEDPARESRTPDDLFADEAPRVTTWAQDFEELQTTGSLPAVTLDAGSLADAADASAVEEVEQETEAPPAPGGARRASRRLRRLRKSAQESVPDEAVAIEPEAEQVTEPQHAVEVEGPDAEPREFLGSYLQLPPDEDHADLGHAEAVEHVVDNRWDLDVDGGEPPAEFLTSFLEPEVGDAERVRIEAESSERRRLEKERDAAEMAERARLAAERAEEERLQTARAQAEQIEAARLERARQEATERERAQRAAMHAEHARLAAEADEAERIAREQADAQRAEDERLAAVRAATIEAEQQRLAAEAAEAQRIETERLSAQRAEDARIERLRLAAVAIEEQRLAAEQAEAARIEAERVAAQQAEDDRLEADRAERERIETERAERARIDAIRAAAVEAETARLETLHLEEARATAARAEAERIEAERIEAERLAEEQAAAQQAEAERLRQIRIAAEAAERERVARENAEAERVAAELAEAERVRREHERLDGERVEAERIAALEARRAAALQEQERIAEGKAEQDRRAAEERERRRQAALLAQQEQVAAQRAEKERAARERAEWEREARERARRAAAPQVPRPGAVAAALAGEAVELDVPEPAVSRPAPAHRTTPVGSRAGSTEPIPRFVEFRPGNVLAYVFGTLFTIFSVGAVLTILWAVSDGSGQSIVGAAVLTGLAMVSWWALLNWAPPVVSIGDGLLEISRGAQSKSWDLRDPDTDITFRGRPSSRTWKAVLRGDDGRTVTIPARLVDASQFVQLVEHYQTSGPEIDDAT